MLWDARTYDEKFGFVTEYGDELLELLDVAPGSTVLDVGCGTGAHAAELARRGFEVVGVDSDPAMLARAAEEHPDVEFIAADAQTLELGRTFDAAISNAALHWMTDQAAALSSIRRALRPAAPFVAEMGGKDNVATVDAAVVAAAGELGVSIPPIRKFFPSVAQEATLLEAAGFDVSGMWWFPRPTRLVAGRTPADWTRLFRADVWEAVEPAQHARFGSLIDEHCRALRDDRGWFIDYHRLRFVARANLTIG